MYQYTNKNQVAVFDGKKFTLYENDKPIMSWDAVSGNKGYQTPEFQSMKDKGTIPEGTYVARQSGLQHYDDYSFVKNSQTGKEAPQIGGGIEYG